MEQPTAYFSSNHSPIQSFLQDRKLLLIIVLLIILLIATLAIYQKSQTTPKSSFNPAEKASSLDMIFKDAYAARRNGDGSIDYFLKGRIESIAEKQTGSYLITLSSISGNSMGNLVTFSLPKVPPKEGSDVLGKDFQEMYNRGFQTVDIRIGFNKDGDFTGWELQKITN